MSYVSVHTSEQESPVRGLFCSGEGVVHNSSEGEKSMTSFDKPRELPEHPGTGGNAAQLPKTQPGDPTAAPLLGQQHLTGNNGPQMGEVPHKPRERDPRAWDVV